MRNGRSMYLKICAIFGANFKKHAARAKNDCAGWRQIWCASSAAKRLARAFFSARSLSCLYARNIDKLTAELSLAAFSVLDSTCAPHEFPLLARTPAATSIYFDANDFKLFSYYSIYESINCANGSNYKKTP